ncbi:hypothetical protein FA13DRAFT_1726277 [Coprinellus micaceus]|uniref:F-box domain-containing protein n=1 Tax=Coprinellus micaceus TaxID=71717 RepID=A0A4Y7TU63_COPMI|nr:hypothetical protein FA13DRAFT_1726277 [Coprinellus micaceus]
MAKLSSMSNATRVLAESAGVYDTGLYQDKLAQRILLLKEEIRVLQSCHNSVTPICRLPPEILSNIFVKLFRSFEKPNEWNPQTEWIRVSHVCAHWRSVALDCVTLWTRPHFTVLKFVRLALRRAGGAPLDVHFPYEAPGDFEEILGQLLSHPDSLRAVELGIDRYPSCGGGYDSDYEGGIRDLPSARVVAKWTHAPLLRELVLIGRIPSQEPFPDTFLRRGAPSLQHLDLRYLGLHWKVVPLGCQLRTLRLSHKFGDVEHRPLVAEFVASVRGMPRLEHLELKEYTPRQLLLSDAPIGTRLSFPALRRLEVTDTETYLSQFFRIIEIPNAATTMVKLIRGAERTDGLVAISQTLASLKLAFRDDSKIHTGVQGLQCDREPTPTCFHMYFEDKGVELYGSPPLLTVRFERLCVRTHKALDLVDSHLDLSTVRCLDLSLRSDLLRLADDIWRSLECLHVHTLILGCHDLQSFVSLYTSPPLHGVTTLSSRNTRSMGHDDTEGQSSPYPFPELSTLICRDIATRPRLFGGIVPIEPLIEPLIEVLQMRAAAGYPLAELLIDSCDIEVEPTNIQQLGDLLPELKVVVNLCFKPETAPPPQLESDSEDD